MALPLGMVVALAVAMLLNTKIRGVTIYRTIVFLPSLVPAVASAMIWLWLFNAKLGLINTPCATSASPKPPRLADRRASGRMPALVLMSFWGVGNTVVIYLAGLQDVPRELYEAADIDGASAAEADLARDAAADFAGDIFQPDHGDHRHGAGVRHAVHHDRRRAGPCDATSTPCTCTTTRSAI